MNTTKKDVTYQWLQNGQPLSGYEYSNPIVYLKGDIDLNGSKFTCKIRSGSDSTPSITRPITLKVSCVLDEHRQSLASMYLAMPEVPEDTWPPQGSKKYINLALIRQGTKLNYRNKYVHQTIRNDLDDVLQHKEEIEYDAVLNSLESGQVLFVEGRPGCGKTTFVHKITRDWAIANHGPLRLMLLVSLRVLNLLYLQKPTLDLIDILKLFNKLKVQKEALEERDGRGVCFIFDGLDEFSPRDGNNSIVYKIIQKSYLRESTVIVASRPAAIAKWRSKANKVIEVLGFLKEQILEYFDSYPFSEELKSAELRTYLLSHPNILHMCYLPIHSAMVAYLYEVIGEIPRTETEIYTHFMRSTLKRSLSKTVSEEKVNVTNLSSNEKKLFNQICKLALQKTIENKQFLQQDEVRESFENPSGGDISLGLITIDRVADLYNYKNIYTFLHLTFQEYLAACHIPTLSLQEQRELVDKHGMKDHMLVVWKFYCGLVKADSPDSLFEEVISKTARRTLHNIQCAYESQEKNGCKVVLEKANGIFNFESQYLTIPDFTALGYVLANNEFSCPVSLLLKSPDDEEVDALVTETGRNTCVLRELIYSSDTIKLGCLKELLGISKSLQVLKLVSTTRSFNSLDAISETFGQSCSELTELNVSNICIGPQNLQFLLNRSQQLKRLALHNSSTMKEVMVLMEELRSCPSLELQFSDSCELLGEDTPDIVARMFQLASAFDTIQCDIVKRRMNLSLSRQSSISKNTTEIYYNKSKRLNRVKLIGCSREVVSAAADGIKHVKDLEELVTHNYSGHLNEQLKLIKNLNHKSLRIVDLDGIGLDTMAVRALFTNLKNCSNLYTLLLSGSRVGKEGVECISFLLWRNLRELNLNGTKRETNIGKSGAEVLADNLGYGHCLSELHLEYNDIDDKLRLLLFRKLSLNEYFTILHLSFNPVEEKWAKTITASEITAEMTSLETESSTTRCELM